jgi:hypothetical protein
MKSAQVYSVRGSEFTDRQDLPHARLHSCNRAILRSNHTHAVDAPCRNFSGRLVESSKYSHSSIRARSTRLAGSVRDRATAVNLATSSSLSANSIVRRHPVMVSIPLPNQSSEATTHVSKNESSPYDGFQRIELLVIAIQTRSEMSWLKP